MIATAVEEQTATTNEISRSVAEGARGSSEIAASIASVAKAASDTTDGAIRSREATAALTRMGAELHALVEKFTVTTESTIAPTRTQAPRTQPMRTQQPRSESPYPPPTSRPAAARTTARTRPTRVTWSGSHGGRA